MHTDNIFSRLASVLLRDVIFFIFIFWFFIRGYLFRFLI